MKEGTFKLPLYWGKLWKNLEDYEVGIIIDAVFAEAMGLSFREYDYTRISSLSKEGQEVAEKCFNDIHYQKTHPNAYRKPEDVRQIRNCQEYREWRTAVFERDGYTCQNCGQKGGKLNAHHMKPFALYPELRLDVDNGITLCKECHAMAHRKKAI